MIVKQLFDAWCSVAVEHIHVDNADRSTVAEVMLNNLSDRRLTWAASTWNTYKYYLAALLFYVLLQFLHKGKNVHQKSGVDVF